MIGRAALHKTEARVMSGFASPRVCWGLLFGFSSGLPQPLTSVTLAAWLTAEKVDVETIGLFSLVSLPYSLKPLWAPLLDRYALPFAIRPGSTRGAAILGSTPRVLGNPVVVAGVGVTHLRYPVRKT